MTPAERAAAYMRVFPSHSKLTTRRNELGIHNERIYGTIDLTLCPECGQHLPPEGTDESEELGGTWIIGSLFKRPNEYYGAFPHRLKERIMALFPDCQRKVLHMFSGTVSDLNSITFDINPAVKPTICDDARNVKLHRDQLSDVQLCISDPPYEKRDFERYGQKPFNKAQVIRDLGEAMPKGSYLCWLDLMVPMYDKRVWDLFAQIGVVVSTNTRARMLSIWKHV